jgi:hypothetical protein
MKSTSFLLLFQMLMVAFAGFLHLSSQTKESLESTMALFSQGLDRSLSHFQNELTQVMAEPTLQPSVDWQLGHSLETLTKSYLRPGEITSLKLFNEACFDISMAVMPGTPDQKCLSTSPTELNFSWLDEQTPVVTTKRRVNLDRQKIWLIAQMKIDSAWFDEFPLLRDQMAASGIKLHPLQPGEKRTSLHRTFTYKKSSFDYRIGTSSVTAGLVFFAFPEGLPLAVMAMVLVTSMILLSKFFNLTRSATKPYRLFIEWILGRKEKGTRWLDHPEIDQAALEVNQLREHLTELQSKVETEHNKADKLTLNLSELTDKITRNSQQSILVSSRNLQIAELSRVMTKRLSFLRDEVEDLNILAGSVIAKEPYSLQHMMTEWQLEMTTTSTRKFLRTLSERLTLSGSNELDEAVEKIISTSRAINRQSVSMCLETKKLTKLCETLARYTMTWREYLRNGKASLPLGKVLADCHFLVHYGLFQTPPLEQRAATLEALLKDDKISQVFSALYHVHKAIFGLNPTVKPNASQVSVEAQLSQFNLVITLTRKLPAAAQYGEGVKEHLAFAKELLGVLDGKIYSKDFGQGAFEFIVSLPVEHFSIPKATPSINHSKDRNDMRVQEV